jgi:hypothetical protein
VHADKKKLFKALLKKKFILKMEKRPTKLVAPDGGYGWVATFGVSLVNVR